MDSSRKTVMRTVVWMATVAFITVSGGLACETRDSLIADPGGSSPTPATPAPSTPDAATTPTPPTPPPPAGDPVSIMQDLLARWNQVVASTPSTFDFHWTTFDQFPHPTFKGGSAAAYQAFAQVLLAFFQHDDDFDFLARNHLFGTRLRYVFPSGQVGIDTSFKELAVYLSTSAGFAGIPDNTRASLQEFADRMAP